MSLSPHISSWMAPSPDALPRAVCCPCPGDEELLGRSAGVQTPFPLWGEGVQWVWRGQKGGSEGHTLSCWSCRHTLSCWSGDALFPSAAEGVTGAGSPGCPMAPSPQSLHNSPFLTSQLLPRA